MRPRDNPQPRKKLIYFIASMVLHLFLGGLLIYFYSSFPSSSGEELPEALIATTGGKSSTPPQPPPLSPISGLSSPAASVPENKETAPEKIKEPGSLEGNARPEILRPATPVLKDKPVAVTLTPSRPEKKLPSQESTTARESGADKSLKPDTSSPKQYSPIPAARSGSKEKAKPRLATKLTLSAALPKIGVSRAQFTTGIKQREPIDQVGPVIPATGNGIKQLYYFTEIKGMRGETIIHRWEHEGQVVAKVQLRIGSNQWRTYSSKNLIPAMTGNWRVVVVDSQGKPIQTGHFVYTEP